MEKTKKSFGTHDGTFHADEVTACAFFILFDCVDKDKIYRTRDEDILKKCEYVCDVGGKYNEKEKIFDHHQIDYKGDFSSAGMVLLYLKNKDIISKEIYDYFNQSFVLGVDEHDIGKARLISGYCSFSQIISSFVPVDENLKSNDFDKAFFEALEFVFNYVKRLLKKFEYLKKAKKIVKKHMETKKKYLIFENPISWIDSFFELGGENHPSLFIIMPSGSHWKLRGIPPSFEDRMNVRVPLPKEWCGLRGEDLKRVSKIKGAIFCHKGRFISIWETKEDAKKALDYVLKKNGLL